MLKISNNVDNPVCVQLDRTVTPGKWRTAGSNIAPSAPVIIAVSPAKTTNVQASLTIPAGIFTRVMCEPGTNKLWSYVAADKCTVNTSTDRFTVGSEYKPVNGDRVILQGTTAPSGAPFGVEYFVVKATGQSCSLATTLNGTKLNITTSGTSVVMARLLDHLLANNNEIIFGSSGTPPTGLASKNYFVTDKTTYSFKIADSEGGSAINFSTSGVSNLQQTIFKVASSQRIGGVALIFTVDVDAFPGSASNNIIKVAIIPSTYATVITSSR